MAGNFSGSFATSGGFLLGALRVVQPVAAQPAALQKYLLLPAPRAGWP